MRGWNPRFNCSDFLFFRWLLFGCSVLYDLFIVCLKALILRYFVENVCKAVKLKLSKVMREKFVNAEKLWKLDFSLPIVKFLKNEVRLCNRHTYDGRLFWMFFVSFFAPGALNSRKAHQRCFWECWFPGCWLIGAEILT